MSDTALPTTARTLEPEERKAALARAVANEVRGGWHVQSQTDYQAVLLKPGTKVNHVLHLILTLVTLGLWAIVWIVVALTHKREHRAVIDVDAYGNVNVQK
jgi:hypothetical protein